MSGPEFDRPSRKDPGRTLQRKSRDGDKVTTVGPRAELAVPSGEQHRTPRAFVSYAWDGDEHVARVRELASRLRSNGVEVQLDRWHAAPGDQLPQFMERAVRENDYVLILCTPRYKQKSDARKGGVGYEGDIMTAEVFAKGNHRKYIPILLDGRWADAAPSWLRGKFYIDLSGEPYDDKQYQELLATLHDARESAPPVGPRPAFGSRGE